MKDLTELNKAVGMVFEVFGIEEPAFVIAFTEKKNDHKQVFWVSSTSRMDSIKLLDSLSEKMKAQMN